MHYPTVKTGLDRLAETRCARLQGRRPVVLCHAASIASDLRHITQVLHDDGVEVVRYFGPEHGIWADAQDMIAVDEDWVEPLSRRPVVSLYGHDEASLAPTVADFDGADCLVVDLQDVGARYYTYIYTAALAARTAAQAGVPVLILDRPNPLGGVEVEGRLTGDDFLSFVGMWPLPTRHGLTIGEVVCFLNEREGFGAEIDVLEMEGWSRRMYFDDTGLPWVQPSPNMPTLDTAIVYPGMCLIEGTELSEGRGTTRPFELIGADFIDPFECAAALNQIELPGIRFRPVFFQPTFHKFGGQTIGGIALHVIDRGRLQPLRMGLQMLGVIRRLYGEKLTWRTKAYEFVTDRLAIDLLFGEAQVREAIDRGASPTELDRLWTGWQSEAERFVGERAPFLRYR
ncbi:MAG: DUF1343 domain-containing protein [Myxococcota bacterium]|nr:DUF1343 domain-containing protein [Myxococcota bacterium]